MTITNMKEAGEPKQHKPTKGPKPCPHCDKTFVKTEHLRRHQRTHSPARPYTCETCGKAFNRSDILGRHRKLHQDDTPYTMPHPYGETPVELPSPMHEMPVQQEPWPRAPLESLDTDWDPNMLSLFGPDLLSNLPVDFGVDNSAWVSPPSFELTAMPSAVSDFPNASFSSVYASNAAVLASIKAAWPTVIDSPQRDILNPISRADSEPLPTVSASQSRSSGLEPLNSCSPAFLEAATNAFFNATSSTRTLIHRPTFDYRRHAPLLRLAICATGALWLGTEEGDAFATSVFNRMGILLQQHWTDVSPFQIDFIVCAILTQKHFLQEGQPHMLSRAFALHSRILESARRCALFAEGAFDVPDMLLPMHDPRQLELLWRKWASAQSASRLVAAILHMETVISGLLANDVLPPSLPAVSIHLNLPTTDPAAFDAPTAAAWAAIFSTQRRPYFLSLTDVLRDLYEPPPSKPVIMPPDALNLEGWARLALLDGVRSQFRIRCLSRFSGLSGGLSKDHESLWALDGLRRRSLLHKSERSNWTDNLISTRWHGSHVSIIANTELVQSAFGREGAHASAKAFEKLSSISSEWASRPLARRGVIHAGQVLRLLSLTSPNERSPFPVFEQLPFKSTLYLLAYSLLAPSSGSNLQCENDLCLTADNIDPDALGSAGIDNRELSAAELAYCTPAVRFMYLGGSCRIVPGIPLETQAGRIALLEYASKHFSHPQYGSSTSLGRAYAYIINCWAEIMRSLSV